MHLERLGVCELPSAERPRAQPNADRLPVLTLDTQDLQRAGSQLSAATKIVRQSLCLKIRPD